MIHLAALLAATGSTTTAATTATTVASSAHKSSGSILDPIAKPIAWVLAQIYAVIPNYAIAIIVLSVLWMLIISPLTLKSTRSMLAMQKLQPELKKLQEKHKDDRQAFAQAQMDLFREHNVSPFGSCLPMLLPLPIFFGLYRVITGLGHKVTGVAADCTTHVAGVTSACPKYLGHNTRMYHDIQASGGNLHAFGMNLSLHAFSPHSSFWAALPFWILVLVMAVTGYVQSAQMMSRNPAAAQNPQMRLMKYLPLVFVVFFINFPAGVLLYYAMSNICRIVQQDLMYRFDPKVKTLVAQEVQEVEAHTHEIDEEKAGRSKTGSDGAARGPTPATGKTGKGGGSGTTSGSGRAETSSGTGASGGRSRFRALLAAAAEQQQQRSTAPKQPKAGNTGTAGKETPAAKPTGNTGTAGRGTPPAKPASSAPPGSKASPSTSNGSDASAPAKESPNGKPAGSAQGQSRSSKPPPKPPPKGGHRTNRKRRR
jgi:YidC/Oxa1 family membrane protein insertase